MSTVRIVNLATTLKITLSVFDFLPFHLVRERSQNNFANITFIDETDRIDVNKTTNGILRK